MLALAPVRPPISERPLFRARVVRVALAGETELVDVRRDLRAVGTTYDHGPDWRRTQALMIFGGRGVRGQDPGSGTPASLWVTRPVAISGPRDFILSYQHYRTGQGFYRSARLTGDRAVVGRRVKAPAPPVPTAGFLSSELIPFSPSLWPATTGKMNVFSKRVEVGWAPLRDNVKVGFVSNSPMSADGDGPYFYNHLENALVKENGQIQTLASRTIGAPREGFGAILYISLQGWFVVTVGQGDGLAWMEQIRR